MRLVLALVIAFTASTAHAAESPQPARLTTNPTVLMLRAHGGVAHGALFGLPVTGLVRGVGGGGGVRRWWGGFDAFADMTYETLSTPHGVGVHRIALGFTAELLLWRLRVGGGLDLGTTWIGRLSGSDVAAQKHHLGLHAIVGADLFTVEHVTVYVAARGDKNAAVSTIGASGGLRYAF